MNGPKEQAVRDTLADRLAGELPKLPKRSETDGTAETTFAAIFNGVRSPEIWPNGMFKCGKAEAEWGWPTTWEQLQEAGLIKFEIQPPDASGFRKVHLEVTELGRAVRDDDLAYFKEIMRAGREDDADAADDLSEVQVADLVFRIESGEPLWQIRQATGIDFGPIEVIRERIEMRIMRVSEGTQAEHLTTDGAEPPVNGAE